MPNALPKKIIFFNNGNTICFDVEGKQIPELQKSWFLLFVEELVSKKIDPLTIEFELPLGSAIIFETSHGYNWRFKSLMR